MLTKPESKKVPDRRRLFDRPLGPLGTLRNEMEEWMGDLFGDGDMLTAVTQPRLDISETDTEVEVQTDVPGFTADEIDIEVRDEMLIVRGEHSEETKSKDKAKKTDGRTYHHVERRSGSFSRSLWLPSDVNAEAVQAELKNGVLTVTLPKIKEAKTLKVKVKGK